MKNIILALVVLLFFDGERVDGASSTEEIEAWLLSRLYNVFIIEEHPTVILNGQRQLMRFSKECNYEKTIFGSQIVCE